MSSKLVLFWMATTAYSGSLTHLPQSSILNARAKGAIVNPARERKIGTDSTLKQENIWMEYIIIT
jgi:hypothetical protein